MKTTIHIPSGQLLDPYLRAHRRDCEFRLGPGEYFTEGHFAFDQFGYVALGPDCDLIGAGSGQTGIYLTPEKVPAGAAQIEALTCGAGISPVHPGVSSTTRVEGITLDLGPAVNHKLALVGVHTASLQAIVRDVHVYGVTGRRGAAAAGVSSEGFGILINRPHHGSALASIAGTLVEDCSVCVGNLTDSAADPEHYVCAVYVGLVGGRTLAPALVDRVSIRLAAPGARAHAAIGTNGNVQWSRVNVQPGFQRAIFCDTDSGEDTMFTECQLRAQYAILDLRTSKETDVWTNIRVQNSSLVLDAGGTADHAAIMTLAAHPKAPAGLSTFNGIAIHGCGIRNETLVPVYEGSLDAPTATACGFWDNTWLGPRSAWKPPVFTPRVVSGFAAWKTDFPR